MCLEGLVLKNKWLITLIVLSREVFDNSKVFPIIQCYCSFYNFEDMFKYRYMKYNLYGKPFFSCFKLSKWARTIYTI